MHTQIGRERRIENLLGLNMHSVDRVLPGHQHPQVGDTVGYGKDSMRFERIEPERVLVTHSEDGRVWSFVLDEQDGTEDAALHQAAGGTPRRRT